MLVAVYAAYLLLWTAVIVLTPAIHALIPLAAIALSTLFTLVFFSWRRTKPVYEYDIAAGILTVAVIYAGRSRRKLLETEIKDALLIAPDDGSYAGKLKDYSPEKEYRAVFAPSEQNYFMLFENGDGQKAVLYFFGDPALVRFLRRHNGRTVCRNAG